MKGADGGCAAPQVDPDLRAYLASLPQHPGIQVKVAALVELGLALERTRLREARAVETEADAAA